MHPFDLKSASLAKHAQHVVLIDFPIALFQTGVMFDFIVHWTKNRVLAAVAYHNLLGRRSRVCHYWRQAFSPGAGNWKASG